LWWADRSMGLAWWRSHMVADWRSYWNSVAACQGVAIGACLPESSSTYIQIIDQCSWFLWQIKSMP
jgi:hypothetical protein